MTSNGNSSSINAFKVSAICKLAGMQYFAAAPGHDDIIVRVTITSPVTAYVKRICIPATARVKRDRIDGPSCYHCHESRVKCSNKDDRPCPRCIEFGLKCDMRPRKRRRVMVPKHKNPPATDSASPQADDIKPSPLVQIAEVVQQDVG